MPPIRTSKTDGSNRYGFPILGDISERLSERLDVSALNGTDLIDADGFLKPGAPLRLDDQMLVPISGGGQTVRGVVLETTKVAKSGATADLNAAMDFDVVIVVGATVDRAIVEFNLGRVLSANELAAFDANDRITLTDPES